MEEICLRNMNMLSKTATLKRVASFPKKERSSLFPKEGEK